MKEKQKSKKTLSTKVIVPVVAFGVVAVATLSSVSMVSAQDSESGRESLITKLASRFGLNETEVKDTFEEFRLERGEERHEKMEERLEEKLSEAVDSGTLTEEQKFAVLEKHEELEDKFEDLQDLSPEDRREARADIHEEMQAWADENGIDMEKIGQFERRMNGEGNERGRGGRFMNAE